MWPPSTNRPRIIEFASPRSFIRGRNSWMDRMGANPAFGEKSLVNSRKMGLVVAVHEWITMANLHV